MTKQEIRNKMDLAVKQGYIYVNHFISKKIYKLALDGWDETKRVCLYGLVYGLDVLYCLCKRLWQNLGFNGK